MPSARNWRSPPNHTTTMRSTSFGAASRAEAIVVGAAESPLCAGERRLIDQPCPSDRAHVVGLEKQQQNHGDDGRDDAAREDVVPASHTLRHAPTGPGHMTG